MTIIPILGILAAALVIVLTVEFVPSLSSKRAASVLERLDTPANQEPFRAAALAPSARKAGGEMDAGRVSCARFRQTCTGRRWVASGAAGPPRSSSLYA